MRRTFCEWIFDEVEMGVGSYEGKPVPNGQVASEGRRCTGSAGSGFDSV